MSRCARTTTAALIVALCAAVAPAASAAPIRACANKKTGVLRVLTGRKRCKRSERKLSWNLAGQNGAAGIPGAPGQQGPKGDAGLQGAQGPQGVQGLPGASLIGAPAGGALTGFFPNPLIALDAVSGPQVLDNSLTGADIDESTLGKVPNSDLLDGIDSAGFLPVAGKAADANLLDGIDSTGFLAATAKAADSNLLDGVDSSGFLREIASGSNALDLSSIAALGCSSALLGSATAHGAFVLVNDPYDALAGITSGTPSLLDVSAVRVPNGSGDDIWLKVCNLNPLNVINPSSATFNWALVG